MKFKKGLSLLLCFLAIFSLSGCSKTESANKIVVGTTAIPGEELFEYLREDIEDKGYELEIKVFNDFVTPNTALNEGELDANLFQHIPFLENTVKEKGYDLSSAIGLYECPLILFSKKIDSINDIKSESQIAIPNDSTNGSRALLYLEDMNLIKLNDSEIPGTKDIIENHKNLDIVEVEASQLPAMLEDVDAAFINSTFSVPAGLDANKYGIYTPNIDGTYTNVLACKTADLESEKIAVLKDVLSSDKSKDFINSNFKGIIIPVF